MIRNDSEFLQLAIKSYDNPILTSVADFERDIKRFGYLNTMIRRYNQEKSLDKLRQALNHLVILTNVFGIIQTVELVRYKLNENVNDVETMMFFLKMIEITKYELNFELLNILEEL